LYAKKLERWCGAVRERAENMLPSSLKTPAASALLSSETLNVVTTAAAHSVGAEESECESGAENESERDGEDDDDSDDDLEIVGEESGLRTVQALHQQGPKRRPKRPRSR
jgi:hypothetical protein